MGSLFSTPAPKPPEIPAAPKKSEVDLDSVSQERLRRQAQAGRMANLLSDQKKVGQMVSL